MTVSSPPRPRAEVRRQARERAMQALFEHDLVGHDPQDMLALDEQAPTEVLAYASRLVRTVQEHQMEIDARLARAAPEWPLARMSNVDRNILRVAVAELLYDQHMPAKAAINEAVEIAKEFGGDTSGRFVNGVLGAILNQRSDPSPTMLPKGEE